MTENDKTTVLLTASELRGSDAAGSGLGQDSRPVAASNSTRQE